MRPAVFLDRDGTVIQHVHHLKRMEDVALIPGAASALRALRERGYACVIITNQSVIGRGMLDFAGLDRIHARMNELLAADGASIDGIYVSPHVPDTSDQSVIEHPDRKPGPGLLLRAAADLDLDLPRSYMMGDSLSDLLAGENAGCRESILVLTGYGEKTHLAHGARFRAAQSIVEGVEYILESSSRSLSK